MGKSTLLNAALAQPLAIVSPLPQTTRVSLLGIVRHHGAELRIVDTPGLHKARGSLGQRMNRSARSALRGSDIVVFVTDIGKSAHAKYPEPGDRVLLADLSEEQPAILVLNKIDKLKDRAAVLPIIQAFAALFPFKAIVPISARREDGVERVLDTLAELCPQGPATYDADTVTDKPSRFFAAEFVREQILSRAQREVPHATAVVIEDWVEKDNGVTVIHATIVVERDGQKRILVGRQGQVIKDIGTAARQRLIQLLGTRVHLELFVKVEPNWRENPARLEEYGYGGKTA